MENFKIKNLTFSYPDNHKPILYDINFTIKQGEFITICGKSGCGKTTLLRHLKPALTPTGDKTGEIYFEGKPINELDDRTKCQKIGYVLQNPDNQIVTDKVWHELAFGLESLGMKTNEIRNRVAEMASFFGIQNWFYKSVSDLSGGQKQLLNLASIMVMQPSVLILDEPTSQLDPIVAQDFLKTISRINRELGTTVILTEHRLEDAFPISDRVIVMDKGKIIADDCPQNICQKLKSLNHDMFSALPAPMRIYAAVDNTLNCPVTVREGRNWLDEFSKTTDLKPVLADKTNTQQNETVVQIQNVWFRYDKGMQDVLKGVNAQIHKGELYAIVGGNGTGKTTVLSAIGGLLSPYRGKIVLKEKTALLPQNPQALFVKKTVKLDLQEILKDKNISDEEKEIRIKKIMNLCEIEHLAQRHPYDLSGGEQQRTALAKILLLNPQILLLDEPTKGLDAHFKEKLANIIYNLKQNGITIIMVSHDIEFCAKNADRCAMFFDGTIVSENNPREFFSGKSFYTTATNRMARHKLPKAILSDDVILSCGGKLPEIKKHTKEYIYDTETKEIVKDNKEKLKLKASNVIIGSIFLVLFIITVTLFSKKWTDWKDVLVQIATILELGIALLNFIPKRHTDYPVEIYTPKERRKLSKYTVISSIMVILAVPITIFTGMYVFDNGKYYFISLLIILEILIPFIFNFESRKPLARELIVISVLCAIAVAGRIVFTPLPQFKPVMAMVIISGVCFGAETGFLTGAITAFVSNFYFSQGPWTPWQMFAFGIVGFLSGIFFKKGIVKKQKLSLSIYGALAVIILYGGISNPSTILLYYENPTVEMILSSYLAGFPFDVIHAVATGFFLWFISEPMIEKLERIKIKYGLEK